MKLLRKKVEAYFGREIPLLVDPKQAIVHGAALVAQDLAGMRE
ncbi:MAG: hypothetical protein V1754_02400 [Pseudomonadota bacterium]